MQRRLIQWALAVTILSSALPAQTPHIDYRGVVNAASFAPQGVPGGSIARGSVFSIFGRDLGPATPATQPAYPLTETLAGVSIEISQGGTVRAAIPIFVLASQISAVMPSTAPLGSVVLRLTYNGRRSNPATVNVVQASPGLLSVNSGGLGPGVVQNFLSQTDQPINTARVTAQPGQTLILWGTGLGPVPHADNIAPTAADSASQVEIFVGGKPANRRYAGRSPCCAGIDQIVFDVPADSLTGCYVPIQVRANRDVVSNSVTIAIHPQGQPCEDAINPVAAALRAGGRIAIAMPERKAMTFTPFNGTPVALTKDHFYGALRNVPASEFYFDPATALPPPGACTLYNDAASQVLGSLLRVAPGIPFGAGAALSVATGANNRTLSPHPALSFLLSTQLGTDLGPPSEPLLFSVPGTFNWLIGAFTGGGPASVAFNSTTPLNWLNREQIGTVRRAQPLTIHWSGGDPVNEVVLIGGMAQDDPRNARASFLCTAPSGAGSFTVSPEITAGLPATPADAVRTPAWLFLSTVRLRQPARFLGPGIDAGFVTPSSAYLHSVVVQ